MIKIFIYDRKPSLLFTYNFKWYIKIKLIGNNLIFKNYADLQHFYFSISEWWFLCMFTLLCEVKKEKNCKLFFFNLN